MSSHACDTLYQHVCLPPNLPGHFNANEQLERDLFDRLLAVCRLLKERDVEHYQIWDNLRRGLETSRNINCRSKLDAASLNGHFVHLNPNDFIAIRVAEQNAGLLTYRTTNDSEDQIIIDSFESSQMCQQVLGADALATDFPACSIASPYNTFLEMREDLAAFLEQASGESIREFAATSFKAGESSRELRDTTDPALITEILMTILEANGVRRYPSLLRKHVRDDVCWNDADRPWRRSPMWLILRVALELHLINTHGLELGRSYYKLLLAIFHTNVLNDFVLQMGPESIAFIRTKLGRRLAKLNEDIKNSSSESQPALLHLFGRFESQFLTVLKCANDHLEATWSGFKRMTRKPIPRLNKSADIRALHLSLPNSRSYLDRVLKQWPPRMTSVTDIAPDHTGSTSSTRFSEFIEQHIKLSTFEEDIRVQSITTNQPGHDSKSCIQLSKRIRQYLSLVANAYDFDPLQKSQFLLLVFELWVEMDRDATRLYPILRDFHTGFSVESLRVLLLPDFRDMDRLLRVEEYISGRNQHCTSYFGVLYNPRKGCFSERYFDRTSHLQPVLEDIEGWASEQWALKKTEWREKSAEYDQLSREIAARSCDDVVIEDEHGLIRHDKKSCKKCYKERCRRRLKVDIHEEPLPQDLVVKKAVVFELCCPPPLAAYRDSTWLIAGTLGRFNFVHGGTSTLPKVLCREYAPLRRWNENTHSIVTLASSKKSFRQTHYSSLQLPVDQDELFKRSGLHFQYFDSQNDLWVDGERKPTFSHHCSMVLPPSTPFSDLTLTQEFTCQGQLHSSYEISASQASCPSNLAGSEFVAYQSLMSSKLLRWHYILLELASSNLNFSEASAISVCHLASEVGPVHREGPIRDFHASLGEPHFCHQLLSQIQNRMNNIRPNWREIHCMDMLLTLLLRLFSIRQGMFPHHPDTPSVLKKATDLLDQARETTLSWIKLLLKESSQVTDVDSSRMINRYAFWSAILCRRTYAIFTGDDAIPLAHVGTFIATSITLRENLPMNIFTQSHSVKSALRRDVRLVSRLRPLLKRALNLDPRCFLAGLSLAWPQAEGVAPRKICSASFLQAEGGNEFRAVVTEGDGHGQQTVQLHILQGTLLIDGKPIGKLPQEHRTSTIVQRLFGSLNIRTVTSPIVGMDYQILQPMNGQIVYLGSRSNSLFARAFVANTVLEYIPQEIFRGGNFSLFDLPAPLIDGCVHWLNLNSRTLEIRPELSKWQQNNHNWTLDLKTFQCRRYESVLVDPNSVYFRTLATSFRGFENYDQLVVYQKYGVVNCELKRLSLSFKVNKFGLLHCQQYGMIDQNQDAGTWYGLASKLVLRDSSNSRKRYILVPTGNIIYKRHGAHIVVQVEGNGSYLTYTINNIIGRVDCPAEPILIYAKATFHALTSFPVPDPLTGRTGAEEAVDFLSSGMCQPWAPLNSLSVSRYLNVLAHISPRRRYYPEDLTVMQRVFWDSNLPIAVQHEAFRDIVSDICQMSQELSAFALQTLESPFEPGPGGDAFLSTRAQARRAIYERAPLNKLSGEFPRVKAYEAREKRKELLAKTYEVVDLIKHEKPNFKTTKDLARCLSQFPVIGGYSRKFDKTIISCFRVDLDLEWGSLAKFCLNASRSDQYKLMFFFALLQYAHPAREELVRALLAYALMDDLKRINLPQWPSYTNFNPRISPKVDALVQLIKPFRVPYDQFQATNGTGRHGRSMRTRPVPSMLAYNERVEKDAKAFAEHLVRQWPSESMSLDDFVSDAIKVQEAIDALAPEWEKFVHNRHLLIHLQEVQSILDSHAIATEGSSAREELQAQERFPDRQRNGETRTIALHFLSKQAPPLPKRTKISRSGGHQVSGAQGTMQDSLEKDKVTKELRYIIAMLARNKTNVYQTYSKALAKSVDALAKYHQENNNCQNSVHLPDLEVLIKEARLDMDYTFQSLCDTFAGDDNSAKWLQHGGLWPPITRVTILQELQSIKTNRFGLNMKERLTIYAISVTTLQRLLRVEDALHKKDMDKALEEWLNAGHENWDPLNNPDWLLLEIESNVLFRPVQVTVAFETIKPQCGSNSVLQMNMGQGKTSCVIPMSAIVLADKRQLMRVVVPKALLLQTAQLLQSRLGGLVGRHITHVPFARKTSTSQEAMKLFRSIHIRTLRRGGVVLALPEHMLSFSLSGLQRLTENRLEDAKHMIDTQRWLHKMCRDIMDESDFTLACKTQLIYPSGSQVTFDGDNHRWETAEILLDLVQSHLWNLESRFASSIEVVSRHGGYPFIFFLRQDVQDELLSRLVDNICAGQFRLVPMSKCSPSERDAVHAFLTNASPSPKDLKKVSEIFPEKPTVRKMLYHLRGLLVHRILLMALSRRWNVQYGLHPKRDPIAVPFSAKGVPSDASEWGHPDVCILFTVLSFYYMGLDADQVRQALDHILKTDDPASEYDVWISGIDALPNSLRDIYSVNLEDVTQVKELSGYLRYQTRMIDCFLNAFVFPRHAKQFEKKLQASSWDLPLFTVNKDVKALTTGFSGTNDNREMLPLTIKQHDLPALLHTNAEVLTYLLQQRNRSYVLAAHANGKRFSELELLAWLSEMKIRILIDAGAQVLELDNFNLARQWLRQDTEAYAAVYFSTGNKAMVLYRNDRTAPLVASPFANNLEKVLVYLDEAHTRGTDLKLPKKAVAGLTLGLGQTKDSTVQAAMRCRELGSTQSVRWIAPPEVHQSILQSRPKASKGEPNSRDVIYWLLQNSCTNIAQLQPLYYAQGINFCERLQTLYDNKGCLEQESQRKALVHVIHDREITSLEEMYFPRQRKSRANATGSSVPAVNQFRRDLQYLRKNFNDPGDAVHPSALQEVEQEREVAYEVEAVRQVQKPVRYKALSFPGLHKDLIHFASTGEYFVRSDAYENAFSMLQKSGLRNKHAIDMRVVKTMRLFCSTEFSRTVQEAKSAPLVHLQRNVNWVLWSFVSETAIVVIPEEAEYLLPRLRHTADPPPCYLLTYSAPTTRKMLSNFNDLNFYAVPSLPTGWKAPQWLKIGLGVFAGRLYFDSDEYPDILKFLGIPKPAGFREQDWNSPRVKQEEGQEKEENTLDLYEKNDLGSMASPLRSMPPFTGDPIAFLQDWLSIRRRGQDFTNSPMGFVSQGKSLTPDHPFFVSKQNRTSGEDSSETTAPQGPPVLNQAPTASHSATPMDQQNDRGDDSYVLDGEDDMGFGDEMDDGNVGLGNEDDALNVDGTGNEEDEVEFDDGISDRD